MDRTAWIVVIACLIGLFVWQYEYTKRFTAPATTEPAEEVADADPTDDPDRGPDVTRVERDESPDRDRADVVSEELEIEEVEEVISVMSNEVVEFRFTNMGAGIDEAILFRHISPQGDPIRLNRFRPTPIGALSFEPEGPESRVGWQVREREDGVHYRHSDGPLEITKSYRWPQEEDAGENYVVMLEVIFRNTGEGDVYRPNVWLNVGSFVPLRPSEWSTYTGFDYYREGRYRHVDVNWFGEGRIPLLGIQTRSARPFYENNGGEFTWAAVKNQFYTSIITALDPRGTEVWAQRFEIPEEEGGRGGMWGIEGSLGLPSLHLQPGEVVRLEYQIYAGPKEYRRLVDLGNHEAELMNFGIFKWISQFLLNSMNWLYGLTGNYAFAIILLTICIRLAMWPLQNKATMSMKRMAALSPKMKELREKYQDDPTKMNQELMQLYKTYKVNPFGGCLPMLVQLPIFFGFYWMLATAVELRNNGFLWVRDLSQPDTIFSVLGFPINVLPLLMAATMVWQMHVTPKTGDVMQRRIMLVLPVIFLVFCYNFASALALYWTVQNLVSIVQLYLTRNQPIPNLEEMTPPSKAEQRRQQKLERRKNKKKGRPL